MAQLETPYAIRKVLADNAGVAAIVSTRIYPLYNIPHNAIAPYVAYSQGSADHAHHLGGASGYAIYGIDVYCVSTTEQGMRTLGTAVRKALDGFTGTVTVSADSVVIDQCHLKAETDDITSPQDGSNDPLHIRQMEFAVGNSTETS
jgi:hypothetical protein